MENTPHKRIFVTGSADGLGQAVARQLVVTGHEVVLHARDEARAREALAGLPGANRALAGDLASLSQTRALAREAEALGPFDAVIHNAGVGYRESARIVTEDGLEHIFQINVLAPYLLTALMPRPQRLIYLSSGLLRGGDPSLEDRQWERRRWDGYQAYADSKLSDAILAAAIARRWPDVISTSVDPGWAPTKMGGPSAPESIEEGAETQVWLATTSEPAGLVSGAHFYRCTQRDASTAVNDVELQEALLDFCAALSGASLASSSQTDRAARGPAND